MPDADLLAIPLFEGLSDQDRAALASRLAEKAWPAGATLVTKGEAGASMYIVASGAVQVYLPPEGHSPAVVLRDLHPGEYFGELSLFDDQPRSASVRATADSVVVELTRDDLGEHLTRSRAAAFAILAEMARRLRETNAMLGQRAAKDAVKEIEENLTWSQRLADKVAELNGSWRFILFLLLLSVSWALLNTSFVGHVLTRPFDDYPFQFYNLFLAVLVALQGPLIVMSQNRQSIKDRAQAATDFHVNLKNEVAIEMLLRDLAAFRGETLRRLAALERPPRPDPPRAQPPVA